MGDEPEIIGANASADINDRVEKLISILDQLDELKLEEKTLKANAKAEGYDMKAFNQVLKEKRKGAAYQTAQLELETVLEAYRNAVKLPTDLAKAQELARDEARADPDEKPKKKQRSRETVVKFPGGSKPN